MWFWHLLNIVIALILGWVFSDIDYKPKKSTAPRWIIAIIGTAVGAFLMTGLRTDFQYAFMGLFCLTGFFVGVIARTREYPLEKDARRIAIAIATERLLQKGQDPTLIDIRGDFYDAVDDLAQSMGVPTSLRSLKPALLPVARMLLSSRYDMSVTMIIAELEKHTRSFIWIRSSQEHPKPVS